MTPGRSDPSVLIWLTIRVEHLGGVGAEETGRRRPARGFASGSGSGGEGGRRQARRGGAERSVGRDAVASLVGSASPRPPRHHPGRRPGRSCCRRGRRPAPSGCQALGPGPRSCPSGPGSAGRPRALHPDGCRGASTCVHRPPPGRLEGASGRGEHGSRGRMEASGPPARFGRAIAHIGAGWSPAPGHLDVTHGGAEHDGVVRAGRGVGEPGGGVRPQAHASYVFSRSTSTEPAGGRSSRRCCRRTALPGGTAGWHLIGARRGTSRCSRHRRRCR